MKKKLFAIICCLAMVLTGGITGLVLGYSNTPKAEQVDVAPTVPEQPDYLPEEIPDQNPEEKGETSKPNVTEDKNTNPNAIEGRKNYTRSAVSSITGGKRIPLKDADAFKLRTYITFEFILIGSNVKIKFNGVELSERLNDYAITERNNIKTITGKYIITGAEKDLGSSSYIDVLFAGNQQNFDIKYIYACDNLYASETCNYDSRFFSYDQSTEIFTANYTNTSSSLAWVNFFVPFTNTFKTNTKYTVVLETWNVKSLRPINFSSPLDGGAGSQLDIAPYAIVFNSANKTVQTQVFTTVSDFSKCSYDFRSYTNVPAGGTMDFKFRIAVYEGEVALHQNLYQASLQNYDSRLSYDTSSNVVSVNYTNTDSMAWLNFSGPFTNTFKTNTTYTAVLEVFDLVGSAEVKLASPNEGGTGQDVASGSLAFYPSQANASNVYFYTFTTASDFSSCKYDFRSYVPVPKGATVNLRFRISVYEGVI